MRLAWFFLTFCLFFAVGEAVARDATEWSSRADMLYDRHFVYDRPWVRSDLTRGQDMFRDSPVMYNRKADMFDGVRKPVYGRQDMLPTLPNGRVPVHVLKIDR